MAEGYAVNSSRACNRKQKVNAIKGASGNCQEPAGNVAGSHSRESSRASLSQLCSRPSMGAKTTRGKQCTAIREQRSWGGAVILPTRPMKVLKLWPCLLLWNSSSHTALCTADRMSAPLLQQVALRSTQGYSTWHQPLRMVFYRAQTSRNGSMHKAYTSCIRPIHVKGFAPATLSMHTYADVNLMPSDCVETQCFATGAFGTPDSTCQAVTLMLERACTSWAGRRELSSQASCGVSMQLLQVRPAGSAMRGTCTCSMHHTTSGNTFS